MKPPMFAPAQSDSSPMDYMHRARQFRRAAMSMSDNVNGEQFWPKYALLTHAVELALKAFVKHSTPSGIPLGREPKQHDLLGWYRLAVDYDMGHDERIEENIDYLNELHRTHYMRYPQRNSTWAPDLSTIADETVDHLLDQITPVTNPR
jgi:hypothetical protein